MAHYQNQDLQRALGQTVRRMRGERTMKWLSERTGIDQGYISRIESGKNNVGVSNLALISGAFGLTLSGFIAEVEADILGEQSPGYSATADGEAAGEMARAG